MKQIIKVEKEINITTLEVDVTPRWWEDTEIDGFRDTEYGDDIPCHDNGKWKPIIDIEKGVITDWEPGKIARIDYKVDNYGIYTLKDEKGNVIEEKYGCVPRIMCPDGNGHGNYIRMNVNATGTIEDWKPDFSDFFEEE